MRRRGYGPTGVSYGEKDGPVAPRPAKLAASNRPLRLYELFWSAVSRLSPALGTALVTIVAARLMTPEAFGEYVAVTAGATFLAFIGHGGYSQAVIGFLSRQDWNIAKKRALYGAVLRRTTAVVLAVATVTAVAYILIRDGRSAEALPLALAVALFMLLRGFLSVVGETARGLGLYWLHGLAGNATGVFSGVAAPVLIVVAMFLLTGHSQLTLPAALWATALGTGGGGLIGQLLLMPHLRTRQKGDNANGLREARPLARSLLVAGLAGQVGTQLSVAIVGVVVSAFASGTFSAAMRLVALLSLPLATVNTFIPVRLAALRSGEPRDASAVLQAAARLSTSILLLPALVVFLFAEEVVTALYGPALKPAGGLARILAIGPVVSTLLGSSGYALMMMGEELLFRRAVLLSAIFLVVTLYPVSSAFGVAGAACAVSLQVASLNVLLWYLARKRLSIDTRVRLRSLQ